MNGKRAWKTFACKFLRMSRKSKRKVHTNKKGIGRFMCKSAYE